MAGKRGKNGGREAEALSVIKQTFGKSEAFKPTSVVKEKLKITGSYSSVLVSGLVKKGHIVATKTRGEYQWPGRAVSGRKKPARSAKAKRRVGRARATQPSGLSDSAREAVRLTLMDSNGQIRPPEERAAIIAAIQQGNQSIEVALKALSSILAEVTGE